MTGTDLNITYEDGLRLSELQGKMNGLEYEMSHLFQTHMTDFAMIATLVVLAAVVALILLESANLCRGFVDKPCEVRATRWHRPEAIRDETSYMVVEWHPTALMCIVCIAVPVLLILAFCAVAWIGIEAGIEMQMAETQGQIDAILAKYGM